MQYQNVCLNTDNFLDTWVYVKTFEEQLNYLSANRVSVIPLHQAVSYFKGESRLQGRAVSLTFDGGLLEQHSLCLPLLKKYGFTATFFIRPDKVGASDEIEGRSVRYMNWDHIRELRQDGFTIALYARKGASLSGASLQEIEEEMSMGHEAFTAELKTSPLYYGVRDGVPTAEMVELIKSRGFEAFFCQAPTRRRIHPYALGRIQIDDNDLNIFLVKISKPYFLLKDSRHWKRLRRWRVDRAAHWLSNTINRLKGKDL